MTRQVIYKYELTQEGVQTIEMPTGVVLHVGVQRDRVYLWVMIDVDGEIKPRRFLVAGTGNPLPELEQGEFRHYLGTVQTPPFVWHVFELGVHAPQVTMTPC